MTIPNSYNILTQFHLSHAAVRQDAREAVLQGLPVRLERGRPLSDMELAAHTEALARHLQSIEQARERAAARIRPEVVADLIKENQKADKAKEALESMTRKIVGQMEAEVSRDVTALRELVPLLGFQAVQIDLNAVKENLRSIELAARQQRQKADVDVLLNEARQETSFWRTLLRRSKVDVSGRHAVVRFFQQVAREGVSLLSRRLLEQTLTHPAAMNGHEPTGDVAAALPEALRARFEDAYLDSDHALDTVLLDETLALVQYRVVTALHSRALAPKASVASKVLMRIGVTVKGKYAAELAPLVEAHLHLQTGELEPITTDEDSTTITAVYVVRELEEVFAFVDLVERENRLSCQTVDRALYARRAHEIYRPSLRLGREAMNLEQVALTALKAMLTPGVAEGSRIKEQISFKLFSGSRTFDSSVELAHLSFSEEWEIHNRFFDTFCNDRAVVTRTVHNLKTEKLPKQLAERAEVFARVVGKRVWQAAVAMLHTQLEQINAEYVS